MPQSYYLRKKDTSKRRGSAVASNPANASKTSISNGLMVQSSYSRGFRGSLAAAKSVNSRSVTFGGAQQMRPSHTSSAASTVGREPPTILHTSNQDHVNMSQLTEDSMGSAAVWLRARGALHGGGQSLESARNTVPLGQKSLSTDGTVSMHGKNSTTISVASAAPTKQTRFAPFQRNEPARFLPTNQAVSTPHRRPPMNASLLYTPRCFAPPRASQGSVSVSSRPTQSSRATTTSLSRTSSATMCRQSDEASQEKRQQEMRDKQDRFWKDMEEASDQQTKQHALMLLELQEKQEEFKSLVDKSSTMLQEQHCVLETKAAKINKDLDSKASSIVKKLHKLLDAGKTQINETVKIGVDTATSKMAQLRDDLVASATPLLRSPVRKVVEALCGPKTTVMSVGSKSRSSSRSSKTSDSQDERSQSILDVFDTSKASSSWSKTDDAPMTDENKYSKHEREKSPRKRSRSSKHKKKEPTKSPFRPGQEVNILVSKVHELEPIASKLPKLCVTPCAKGPPVMSDLDDSPSPKRPTKRKAKVFSTKHRPRVKKNKASGPASWDLDEHVSLLPSRS